MVYPIIFYKLLVSLYPYLYLDVAKRLNQVRLVRFKLKTVSVKKMCHFKQVGIEYIFHMIFFLN